MCLSGMGGQTAGPSLADFTPTPMAVPELELRQRAADWATAHFAATGEPWPQNAPHLHQQLEAAGFRFSLVMVKRVLKWLKDESLAFTVKKIGRVFLFKPVPVEPVTGRLPFVPECLRNRSDPKVNRNRTDPEPKWNRNRTVPEPIPTRSRLKRNRRAFRRAPGTMPNWCLPRRKADHSTAQLEIQCNREGGVRSYSRPLTRRPALTLTPVR